MKTDIEIARSIELVKIKQVARETGIPVEHISNYGRYIAKVDESQKLLTKQASPTTSVQILWIQ